MFGIMTIYLSKIGNIRLFSTLVHVDEKETQVMEEGNDNILPTH